MRLLTTALLVLSFLAASCPRPAATPDRPGARLPRAPRPAPQPFRSGILVTWYGTQEIGRERFEDDGNVASSLFSLGDVAGRARIWRDTGLVRIEIGETRIEHEITDEVVVLENGHWHAYAVLAERFAGQRTPKAVTVVVPSQGASIPATLAVTRDESGQSVVRVSLAGQEIRAEIRRDGTVGRVAVPAQGIEVRRREEGPPAELPPPPPPPEVGPPAGVKETAFEVVRDGVTLRGVLWTPPEGEAWPVAVIIAGSGPTDRDGNSPLGVRADAYRMLAADLARHGVATARFDKRGVGESGRNFEAGAVVLEDFVADAAAIVREVAAHPALTAVNVIGHSEGGLIALRVASRIDLDGLVLLAAAGRPLADVIREQLARGGLDEDTLVAVDRILDQIRAGEAPTDVPAMLAPLFGPQTVAFLASVIDEDPVALLRALPGDLPITVIQGGTDVQISLADAERLAAAREDVPLVVLPEMNHVLKVEAEAKMPQSSYVDPSRPLAPGLVPAVVEALGGVPPRAGASR
jgi:uncharacterized protein